MAHKGRVIVIDDEPSVGDRLSRWLTETKRTCVFVKTYEEAKELLNVQRFDAVVYGHEFSWPSRFSVSATPSRRGTR